MSTTPTLETLHASMQGHTEDVLRMCADIQANLEAQQVLLRRLRRAPGGPWPCFPFPAA